jgi:hypothetical protein
LSRLDNLSGLIGGIHLNGRQRDPRRWVNVSANRLNNPVVKAKLSFSALAIAHNGIDAQG